MKEARAEVAVLAGPGERRGAFLSRVGALSFAVLVLGLLHVRFADVDLNLWDEGFLWYGVERTLEGNVPVRDFQAYNPGRYWWSAGFAKAFGPGLASLRLAGTVFAILGLFCGVRLLQRVDRGLSAAWLRTLLGTLVLGLWMFPRHKLFESSLALMAAWVMVRLFERPSARRHLETGLFVGLAGVFGRNHLLYCGVAFLASFALAHGKRRTPWVEGDGTAASDDDVAGLWRGFLAASIGGLLGLVPLFATMVMAPGFLQAFVDSLTFFLNQPTNQALPYPWPWRIGHTSLAPLERAGVAAMFLVPLVVLVGGALALVLSRGARFARLLPLAGTTVVGGIYLHHASVRSDVWHLAQCVGPSLVGFLGLSLLVAPRLRGVVHACTLGLLVAVTVVVVPATNPALAELRLNGPRPELVPSLVGGDSLRLPRPTAAYLARVRAALAPRLAKDPSGLLFVAPGHSTLYPLLGRRSPFRNVYFLWSAPEEEQRAMVASLESGEPRWVLIVDTAVDGRRDLLYRNTNPLVWSALERNYRRVPTPELPPDHALLRWNGG